MDAFDNLISLNVMGIDVIRERKRKETWVFGTIKKRGGGSDCNAVDKKIFIYLGDA